MLSYCIQKATELPFKKGIARVYAVITDRRGRIVAESANSHTKTHPQQKRIAIQAGLPEKEYLHAELAAIIKSKGKGTSLYVARVDSKGNPCNAKPCPVCGLAIELHGKITNVEYTK